MSRRKVHALSAAALLAAWALVPRAAHGSHAQAPGISGVEPARIVFEAPEVAVPATADTPAEVAPSVPAQDAAPKPKGNSFVRVLTAPFRALARLFGEGGGRKSAAAKGREQKPAEAKQTGPRPADGVAENSAASKPFEDFPPALAPEVQHPPASSAAGQQGVRIVRPDEQALAPTLPRMWIPVIEGIGKDPLTQGRALLERGHLQEAIAELSIAAAAGDNLVEANNLLGLAYDRLGWHRQAVEAYERGLTVAPQDPVLLTNFGYSLYLLNDFDGALKRLRQAARLAPSLTLVHNHLGLVQARLGKYDDAFKSFARAYGEYDAHLRLANLLEFVNRERQAIKHYEAALRLQPGTTAVLERLADLYERTGDRTKADTARRTLGQPKPDRRTTTGGGG